MPRSEPSLGCRSGARCCRAAVRTPHGGLEFGGRRLPTTCETVPWRCSSPSFRPWRIDIQLVRALGLAMFAHFAVVLPM
jgi:hypothetical protein